MAWSKPAFRPIDVERGDSMTVHIYLRKSRTDLELEAGGQEDTLKRHRDTLLSLAARRGYQVGQVYEEVVSGDSIAARPQMQLLLAQVEQGACDGVLVMEVERLARGDTIDQGIVARTFQLSGTKIITPSKIYDPANPSDEEYFEFGLFMSRREYRTINRRLQSGRAASVREGKYVGSKPPYGYRRVKLPRQKGWTLEPDPEQAPIVRLIFQLYTEGALDREGVKTPLGSVSIAHHLDRLGIPTFTGDPYWSGSSVRTILRNPVYIGKVVWMSRPQVKRMEHGEIVRSRPRNLPQDVMVCDGLHPPLVEEELWQTAQALLRKNSRPSSPAGKPLTNPLAGLLVCGVCGRNMVRRPYSKTTRAGLLCPNNHCPTCGSHLDLVEQAVIAALDSWLRDDTNWAVGGSEDPLETMIAAKEAALAAGRRELEKLSQQQDRAYDLLEQGVYDQDTFARRTQLLKSRLAESQQAANLLSEELYQLRQRLHSRRNLLPKVRHLVEVYGEIPTAQEKNNLLREVVEKIIYTKTTRGRGHETDFSIILLPKIE